MDRISYLKELSRNLGRWMPERDREDTLRYYEEYFEEAGPEREAEVMEELGDPEALARRLAEDGGWTKERRTPWKVIGIAAAAVLLAAVVAIGIWTAMQTVPDDSAGNPSVSTGPGNPSNFQGTPSNGADPVSPTDPETTVNPSPNQSQNLSGNSVQAFTEIEANIAVGDVTVRSGAEFQVEAEFRGTIGGVAYRIEYEVVDGTLNIVSFPKNHEDENGDCWAQVTVTVPEDRTLNGIEMELGVGSVTVCDVSVDEVEAETGVGDLFVKNITADSVKLNTGVGDAGMTGAPAEDMELTTGVGDVIVKLDCGSKECGYTITSGVGEIEVDGTVALFGSTQAAPNAPYRLTGATGVGDVNVTFKN